MKHRVWALRVSIERYLHLQQAQMASIVEMSRSAADYTLKQQKLNSEVDAELEAILSKANHLSRALRSKHLPSRLRGRSLRELEVPIRHVRNIREHWDESRAFWSEAAPVPADRKFASARWFKAQHPDKTPWGSSWSSVDGSVICGIIRIDDLMAIVKELETLI